MLLIQNSSVILPIPTPAMTPNGNELSKKSYFCKVSTYQFT